MILDGTTLYQKVETLVGVVGKVLLLVDMAVRSDFKQAYEEVENLNGRVEGVMKCAVEVAEDMQVAKPAAANLKAPRAAPVRYHALFSCRRMEISMEAT